MQMKTIVYMVNTEYHLYVTIGIICKYYSENYNNIIYRVSPIGGKRLNNINLRGVKNTTYKEILYNYSKPDKKLKEKLDELIAIRPDKFFFYLENKFWLNYLLKKLHKSGTKIILGPDGMKAYNDKYNSIWKIKKSIIRNLFLSLKCRLWGVWPLIERYYATSKYIDEVWVENLPLYKNRTNKVARAFSMPQDMIFFTLLNKVFCAKEDDFLPLKGQTILFIDSPIIKKEYIEKTIDILSAFQSAHPDRRLLIKMHQLSSATAKQTYSDKLNVEYLDSNYPAELYIANAENAIIISLVSTSLLFYNPNCKYYWTYQLYGDMFDYSKLKNPTHHIKTISQLSGI